MESKGNFSNSRIFISQQLNDPINFYQVNIPERNSNQQNTSQKFQQKSLENNETRNSIQDKPINKQNSDKMKFKKNKFKQYDDRLDCNNDFSNQVISIKQKIWHTDQSINNFDIFNYTYETSSNNNDENIQNQNESNKNLLKNTDQSKCPNQEIQEIKKKLFYINQQDFQEIINHLKKQENKYQIKYYLNHGGEADILVGTYQQQPNDQLKECVFRMVHKNKKNRRQVEDAFLSSIKKPNFILKHIDKIEFKDKNIVVFVVEKCKFNLKQQENQMTKQNENYTFEELCRLIFSYFYILIELNIKPQNILKDNSGNYVLADFGGAFQSENQKSTKKVFTIDYCPPELIKGGYINHSADIYSTGKSLIEHLNFYLNKKKLNLNSDQKTIQQNQIVQEFRKFIQKNMLEENPQARISCLDLFLEGYKIFGLQNKDLQKFIKLSNKKFYEIEWQNKDDDKKYLQQVIIQLSWIDIQIFIEQHQLNSKPDDIFSEERQQLINTKILNLDQRQIKRYLKIICQLGLLFNFNGDQIKYKYISNHVDYILQKQPEMNIFNKDIAYYHFSQRNYDKAIIYYELFLQSLNINKILNEKKQIKYKEQIYKCYWQIGFCYQQILNFDKSLIYYEKALDLQRKLYNQQNHIEIATTLEHMGELYLNFDQIQKGSQKINEATKVRKQSKQKVSLKKYSYVLIIQALKLQKQNKYSNALKKQKQALRIREKTFGKNGPLIAETCQGIGNSLTEIHQYEEALKYFDRAIQIYSKENENSLKLASSLLSKGVCYQQYNKYNDAIRCHYESIKIKLRNLLDQKKEIVGKENFHIKLEPSFNHICECYIHLGKYNLAVYYMHTYLDIIDQLNLKNQFYKISALNSIASLFLKLEKPKLVLKYTQESLQLIEKQPINYQIKIETFKSNNYLGQAYLMLGEYEQAEQYCLSSYQMITEIFKEDQDRNIHVVHALESVGDCSLYLQKYEKALEFYQKCLLYRQNIYSHKDHLEHSFSYYKLGKYYQFIKDLESSQKYYLESFRIRKINLPQTSPLFIQSKQKALYCKLML